MEIYSKDATRKKKMSQRNEWTAEEQALKKVDDILKHMKESFNSTMSRGPPDDFEPPDCIAQIRDYLRQKRYVIVTGTVGQSHLQVALAAIKDVINEEHNVSAEISSPSEWDHIDPAEIKFILCKNPFGEDVFDQQNAPAMVNVLCQIINSAYAGEMTLAVVTKKDVLVQAQDVFGKNHDVFQNIVEPYAETTEDNPEIILSRQTTSCCPNCQRMPHSALQEMSSCFLAQIEELPLTKSVFEEAKSTLRKERVVVLVGRNECLIRSCIKQLAEQFAPNNCFVISNPDDIKHLDAGVTMVVCLNITGQFAFDISKSRRWFEYFDLIHALVKSNKLRVVLTFEQSALKRCIYKITDHELLRHTVEINYQDVEESRVKREATDEDELSSPVIKRFKTVDDKLRHMKERFDSTMSRELPDDFEPRDCIAQIRNYLRQKRHVIVTGTVGRSYLQVALTAIKEVTNLGLNGCAEIYFPSEWRHIDPSEITLILCTNPFGDNVFDVQKAPVMLDTLCQIMNSAYSGELMLTIVTKKMFSSKLKTCSGRTMMCCKTLLNHMLKQLKKILKSLYLVSR